MKKFFILISILFSVGAASAQCPQYLAFDTTVCGSSISKVIDARVLESRLCGDTVTIYFNDSTTTLSGSRQVYFHTGPEFRPFTGWQNAYTRDSAMRKIGPHLWTISFNPRNFYGFSADSCLNSVVCGFRDSGYVNYVKCGTNDIFIVVASGTPVNTCASATFVTATYTHSSNIIYHWNDSRTDSVRLFTTGGNYSVTATGIGGCTVSGTVTINLDSRKVSIGNDTIECATSSYVFVATPGFTTYQWLDAAASTSNTHQATNPTGGMYWVHAVDSLGCSSSDTASVHLSPTGYLNVLPDTLTSCPGVPVSADASANINFNGDSLVIIYNAAAGLTQLAGDTNVYLYSAPQFYPFAPWPANDPYTVGNFNANDGIGRMTSLGNNLWTITIDPQAYYHYSPDTPLNGIWMVFRNFNGTKTGKDSAGSNNNIFLYTVPNPPTSTFDGIRAYRKSAHVNYTWSNGVHTAADTFTAAGTYYVTATDGVCTHTDSVVVLFTSSGTINIGADTTVCSSADSVLISAGAGYARYAWSNGDTTSTVKVAGANIYGVTVTTAGGCVSAGHRRVNVSGRQVSLGSDIVKCTNTPVLLTATPGFVTYHWLDRAPSPDTITVNKTGSYWVTATDSFGCVSKDTISVRYSDVLHSTLPDTVNSCPGSLVSLDAGSNIQVYGDSIVIFYDATQGQTGLVGASKVYMHSGPEFFPFQGWVANYTVGNWGQDDGVGRMDSLGNNRWSITIFPQAYYKYSPDTPLNGIWMVFRNANGTQTGKDNTGNNIFLNLSGITPTCSFSGVTAIHKAAGTMAYAWSTSSVAPSIAVNTTGNYAVTVTDGTCSHTATSYVNFNSGLSVNIGNDTTICQSGHVVFNAGAGYTTYRWNTGDTTQTITVSAAGTYKVTVTNASGCTGTDSAVVHTSGTKVNAGTDVVRCTKAPYTLSASSGYRSYQWFGVGASSQTHTAVNDGCYWVEATDSLGCTSFDTVSVTTSGVQGLNAHDTVAACTGGSVFDASANINARGDSIVITFDATQNTNSSGLLGSAKMYMHSAPQFYPFAPWGNSQYTVGNWGQDDGVGKMDSIGPNKWQITICPSCYYHYNPDTPLNGLWMVFRNANGTQQTQGGNINIYLPVGGTPSCPYAGVSASYKSTNNITYTWSTSATTPAVTFTSSGTYYVTAAEGACTKVDTILVNQSASPTVNLGNDTCIGSGGAITLNAGSGFATYLWSTGASTQTITANLANTYWVRVTTQAGCTGSDTIIISHGAAVNLGKDTCIYPGGSYLLSAGTGAASYLWNTGATTDTLRVTATGTYWVAVTEGGCVGSDTIVIGSCNHTIPGCLPVPYFRVINISQANTVTFKDSSFRAVHYYWNFGDGTPIDTVPGSAVHTYAGPGTYTVTLRECDSCGCDSFTKVIKVNTTGISEIEGLTGVNLYPNPALNSCTLEFEATESQPVTVEINNMLGEIISMAPYQVTAGSNKLMLDLLRVPSGMYTVTLHSSQGVLTRKLDIIK